MWLNELRVHEGSDSNENDVASRTLLYPASARKKLPEGVPDDIASDFHEAVATLTISPKASAALSRRCLQNIIHETEGIKRRNLSQEIDDLLAQNRLPLDLAEDLDAVRVVGNFAAHPVKDQNTGEIVGVEPGEADWTLGVVEDLLRFYYEDQPARQARRDALRTKLRVSRGGQLQGA